MDKRNEILLKELDIALKNREFEIQLFWQRSNYFLVLITALSIGIVTVNDEFYLFILTAIGLISSWLWFLTNLGSRFWQESWECEVVKISNRLYIDLLREAVMRLTYKLRIL